MIDEITLMQYADGTLTTEEKKVVENEIQYNPEYLKIISKFKKSRDVLLDVSEKVMSEKLPDQIKEIYEIYEKAREATIYEKVKRARPSTVIVSFCTFFVILIVLIKKGVFVKLSFSLVKLFSNLGPFVLELITVFSKKIEAFVF
jgi:hypothetical protein